jgi:hypothetical protein
MMLHGNGHKLEAISIVKVHDRAGSSVSLSSDGKKVAIGNPYNDGNGDWSGHVRTVSSHCSHGNSAIILQLVHNII